MEAGEIIVVVELKLENRSSRTETFSSGENESSGREGEVGTLARGSEAIT